jgi:hypothetical protein
MFTFKKTAFPQASPLVRSILSTLLLYASSACNGMKKEFTYPLMPYSITVLQIETK